MRSTSRVIGPTESKRFAIFSVALCLALAGGGVGLIAAHDHREKVVDSTLSREASPNAAAPFSEDDGTGSAALYAAQRAASPPYASPPGAQPNQSVLPALVGGPAGAGSGALAAPGTGGGVLGGAAANPNAAPHHESAVALGTAQPAQASVEYVVVPVVGFAAGSAAIATALPSAQPPAAAPPAPPVYNFSQQSAICGSSTCNLGEVCCNASCGTCAAPGATCDQTRCENAITYPTSQACGMTTCNVGSVCCNPSCGLCAPQGEQCPQTTC
jgi:hypothetical protein